MFVIEFGNWNYRELAKLSQNELDAFYKHYEQNIRRLSKDAAANNDQGTALIMDWDGFELAHFATSKGYFFTPSIFFSLTHLCMSNFA